MKLDLIQKNHIERAAGLIDYEGISSKNIHSYYWVKLTEEREYPFKYLMRRAYLEATGEKLDFNSDTRTRQYLINLGFKIKYSRFAENTA
jgi:hypothetical protein